jgi:hypothetical protein
MVVAHEWSLRFKTAPERAVSLRVAGRGDSPEAAAEDLDASSNFINLNVIIF